MAFIKTSKAKAAKNRRKATAYKRVCAQVDARDGVFCRVCWAGCQRGRHHHHLTFRSRGGKDTTDNIVVVCGPCHEDIHQHRLTVTGSGNGHLQIERIA